MINSNNKDKSNYVFTILSTADWSEKYKTNKQHLATELADMGYQVIYVESFGLRKPKLNIQDCIRIINRLKNNIFFPFIHKKNKKNEKIKVISPLIFPGFWGNKIISNINQKIISKIINKQLARDIKKHNIFITYHPFINVILNNVNYKKIIYHCVDDLSGLPQLKEIKGLFINKERWLIKKSDYVFTTSMSLFKRIKVINKNTILQSNVIKNEFLKKSLIKNEKRIFDFVYHGVLSEFKINLKYLNLLLIQNREKKFLIIGTEPENQKNKYFQHILKQPNLTYIKYIDYYNLPDYLSKSKFAIFPMKQNLYTKSFFPMKFYEYIANGVNIITISLPFLDNVKKSNFINVLQSNKHLLTNIKKIKFIDIKKNERIKFIGDNRWDKRTEAMLRLILK